MARASMVPAGHLILQATSKRDQTLLPLRRHLSQFQVVFLRFEHKTDMGPVREGELVEPDSTAVVTHASAWPHIPEQVCTELAQRYFSACSRIHV